MAVSKKGLERNRRGKTRRNFTCLKFLQTGKHGACYRRSAGASGCCGPEGVTVDHQAAAVFTLSPSTVQVQLSLDSHSSSSPRLVGLSCWLGLCSQHYNGDTHGL